jgi:hypothetical protein
MSATDLFPTQPFIRLPAAFCYSRYRVTLIPGERTDLPAFLGSTLRGAFGAAFRRLCCTQGRDVCGDCLLWRACPYAVVFESRAQAADGQLRGGEEAPRPFVLEPPIEGHPGPYRPGESLRFNLVLVGQAAAYLPYFVKSFEDMGRTGLGWNRRPFVLSEVRGILPGVGEPVLLYERRGGRLREADLRVFPGAAPATMATRTVRVRYVTPARIKVAGELLSDPSFQDLARALMRRVSLLSHAYCGERWDLDFRAEIDRASSVATRKSSVRWVPLERFSNRQRVKIPISGIVGEQWFAGEDVPHFRPLLDAGAVHVGKGAVAGLGEIEVATMPDALDAVDPAPAA